jgi:hypothetical protein
MPHVTGCTGAKTGKNYTTVRATGSAELTTKGNNPKLLIFFFNFLYTNEYNIASSFVILFVLCTVNDAASVPQGCNRPIDFKLSARGFLF